jgi:hypothetical protein
MVGSGVLVCLVICQRLGLSILIWLCSIMLGGGGGGWGALLVMRSPLYGVVDFHGL